MAWDCDVDYEIAVLFGEAQLKAGLASYSNKRTDGRIPTKGQRVAPAPNLDQYDKMDE